MVGPVISCRQAGGAGTGQAGKVGKVIHPAGRQGQAGSKARSKQGTRQKPGNCVMFNTTTAGV